ncbi:SusC/RagA family TonB-linked outer membrane protein [Pseudobacter ginsenosidimutans]|uniref:TonB-linked SusC/RagA family outer membrane protein n=1 Tax=Pseudobacter ginsenosidimutans TaxID=661488 RepID=A0A4Q7N0A9_9BACT|nr:SusC/RagA family TonB-linked outer membrane protein [Pseudobacter ginsenosidimutans]RZS75021.1 TonB-linked SusC/RagA family outer membrane protein [Pseudobacter ginsenosidimutans]
MRLLAFYLLVASFAVSAKPVAQTITVSGKNFALDQLFNVIEKQTGFMVVYNMDLLENTKPVSVSVRQMPLKDFLKTVFKDQPLGFLVFDNTKTITLSRKQITAPVLKDILNLSPSMDISVRLIAAGTGEPVAGASVTIKGRRAGTISSSAGQFSLSNLSDTASILITSIGFNPVEVSIKRLAALETGTSYLLKTGSVRKVTASEYVITLSLADNILDEAVTTAYSRTSRKLAIGTIGTIKAEDIEKQPVFNALEVLAGKVPGVSVTPISGNRAAPVQVIIRGKNSINETTSTDPLYVVDGIPWTTLNISPYFGRFPTSLGAVQGGFTKTYGENPLLSINPRDIERIDVLKDANATAIYGSRGANGVILITTKKAQKGPASFNMSVSNGLSYVQKYNTLLNTPEYLAVRREALMNDGITPDIYNAPDVMKWDSTKYTDWQRWAAGTGSTTDINARLSGGSLQTNYFLSATYSTIKEPMNLDGKNQRGSFNSSLNHTSANRRFNMTIGNNMAITRVKAYAINDLQSLPPNAPDAYDEKGEFNFEPYRGQYMSEFPFGGLKKPSDSKTFSLASHINVSYELLKGLTLSARAGYNYSQNENGDYTPAAASDPLYPGNYSMAFFGKTLNKSWTVEPQLRYNTYLGRGNLSVQLITNMQSVTTRSETVTASLFPSDEMMKSYMYASLKDFQENYGEYKNVFAVATIRYDWDNKYSINLVGRRDGSSRFGPGKQFGSFGSAGFAWVASEEGWLKKLMPSWMNLVKFSASYGKTGSDNIGDYEYLSRWSNLLVLGGANGMLAYNNVNAFHVIRPLNQDFRWETNLKSDITASLGFLQNKLMLDMTWYSELSKDQLTNVDMPFMTGFGAALENRDAQVRNSGIEFNLSANLINSKDWGLSLSFNIGRNWNKLVDFPSLENSVYKGRLRVGSSTSTMYLLRYTGIDPMTGYYTFEDRNKDGKVYRGSNQFPQEAIDDRYIEVEQEVKYQGGFGINLRWKSLMLSSFFDFENKLGLDPYLLIVPGGRFNSVVPDAIKNNHWKKPGDQAIYPRYTTMPSLLGPIENSDAAWVNRSFVRMNTLSVSWELPATWLNRIKMKGASLAVQTGNLFIFSPYKDINPDMQKLSSAIPRSRTITTRLSFNF